MCSFYTHTCHFNAHITQKQILLPSPGCPGLCSGNLVFPAFCPLSPSSLCDASIINSILQNKPPSLSQNLLLILSLSLSFSLQSTHNGCLLLLVLTPVSQPKQKLNPAYIFLWASIFISQRHAHTSVCPSPPSERFTAKLHLCQMA